METGEKVEDVGKDEGKSDKKAGGKLSVREKAERNKYGARSDGKVITNISEIKSKIRRQQEWVKLKKEKKKEKKKRQDLRKKEREEMGDEAPPKMVPKTIDSMREYDETTVGGKE